MKQFFMAIILLTLSAGCARVPFQETELVPLGSGDPWSMVERFRAGMPENFQLLNTVVFEYNWRTFPPTIGYLDIKRGDHFFKVVGINPMGVKLFELSGDQNSLTTHYAIEALAKYGDIATAVGNDIRRIYFDLVPSSGARVSLKKYRAVFRQPSGQGTMEYIFAGSGADLVEKNYYEDLGLVWRVSYYEYREQNGKRWPQGIVFVHYKYGYRLTVRQKEFRA